MCQLSLLNEASLELCIDDHVYEVTCPGGCIIAWPGISTFESRMGDRALPPPVDTLREAH